MKLNHLGFAARDLKTAIDAFLGMGYTKVHEDVKHHVPKNMFVQRVKLGDLIVEVMAPADATKPSFVGPGLANTSEPFVLHHLCYDVDDIHKMVDDLMATGEYTIYEPITDGVFQKNKICFLKHKYTGLTEFFEWPKA
jgi:catechol 2,3-dioxygenase-like lactoylglutathione lyase family enzyme